MAKMKSATEYEVLVGLNYRPEGASLDDDEVRAEPHDFVDDLPQESIPALLEMEAIRDPNAEPEPEPEPSADSDISESARSSDVTPEPESDIPAKSFSSDVTSEPTEPEPEFRKGGGW